MATMTVLAMRHCISSVVGIYWPPVYVPSNVDPAAGALDELQRIIPAIIDQWPGVMILVRGDSAYSRDDIMSWCEATPNVDYIFAQGSNPRLVQMSYRWQTRATDDYQQRCDQVVTTLAAHLGPEPLSDDDRAALVPEAIHYGCFSYQTLESWSRSRRVVCKVTAGPKGLRHHFVVHLLIHPQSQFSDDSYRFLLPERGDGKSTQRTAA